MNVTGKVDGNSTVFSQNTIISKSATMSGEVFFAAQSVKTNGKLGPLTGFSNDLDITGEVNGDANVYANSLVISKDARIFGSLRYTSEKEATIADGAAVSGIVSHVTPNTDKKSSDIKNIKEKESKSWPSNAVSSVIFYLLLSLIANALFAKKLHRFLKT
jgi:cytoskeletal protein CcmA (bactofilin family)